jgi:hypothetical protein
LLPIAGTENQGGSLRALEHGRSVQHFPVWKRESFELGFESALPHGDPWVASQELCAVVEDTWMPAACSFCSMKSAPIAPRQDLFRH